MIPAGATAAPKLSDAQIKKAIIQQSIANYPGSCACPYNTARNGSSCGGRSAYSRGGGYAPMCYPSDVSKAEVDAYRRGN
ncbi:hypothetical protein DDF62_03175 [Caulobacter radicis]|nr:hypothetical protein DDF62_03095 [Caulobacter radicis]PVM92637.1 hypothetical protein DDF62_03175 [Caulobacter radicis]